MWLKRGEFQGSTLSYCLVRPLEQRRTFVAAPVIKVAIRSLSGLCAQTKAETLRFARSF
jgi:hypothetical protein